ncbi:MMPL family transporter [Schleiferilactobacillus perolens]|uniref:MMPL family transporter n=1 Tax=Schleiferilactobacillus perolens TaxID=100468 RepID=UPI00070B4D79|nr:MMPL family transporter [Schleiferilactobacillus perolens]
MKKFREKHTFALIFWVIVVAIAIFLMPNVTQLTREKGAIKLPNDVESQMATRIEKRANNNKTVRTYIAVFNNGNEKLPADKIADINQAIKNIHSVKGMTVQSITAPNDNAETKKQLIAKDKTTQMAMITVKASGKVQDQSAALRKQIKSSGLKTYITGSDVLNDDFSTITEKGIQKTEVIAIVFILIVLIIVFRSPIVPLASLATVGVAFITSLSIVMNLAQYQNFPISNFTQVFMVVVLFGIGTDYNILLYNTFKGHLGEGLAVADAVRETRRTGGRTILYSGLSVLIGFSVLALAKFSFYQSAVGVAVGVAVLLPVLLTLNMFFMATLGHKLFWPSKTTSGEAESKLWHALSKAGLAQPILVVAAIVIAAVPFALTMNQTLNFNNADELPESLPSKVGYRLIQKHYSKGMTAPSTIYIESKTPLNTQEALGTVDDLTQYLQKESGVKTVASVTQPGGTKIGQLYLKNQLSTVVNGLDQSTKGLKQIQSGLKSANDQLTKADIKGSTEQVQTLANGSQQLQSGAGQLASGVTTYTAGVNQVNNGVNTLQGKTPTLASGVSQLTSATQQLQSGASTLAQGINQYTAGVNQVNSGIASMQGKTPALTNGVSQLTSASGQLATGMKQLNAQVAQVSSLANQLIALANQIPGAGALTEPAQAGLNQLTSGIGQLNTGASQLNGGLGSLNGQLPTLTNGVGQLSAGSQQLAGKSGTLASGANSLASGSTQVNSGMQTLNGQIPALTSGVNQLAQGTNQLANNSGTLNSGATSVSSGTQQVNAGVQQLNTKVKALAVQVTELQKGLSSADDGLTTLEKGNATMKSYLDELQKSYMGDAFYIPKETISSKTFKPALDNYMADGNKITTLTMVFNGDPATLASAKKLRTIQSDIKAKLKHGPLKDAKVAIGGQTSQTADLEELANGDFLRTAVIMVVGIAIALMVVTRSIIQPLAILGTLLMAYVTSLSLTHLITDKLLGVPLLTWNTPFFSFIMLIALGVDYSIFLMIRFRDQRGQEPAVDKRMLHSATVIGAVVISAAVILSGTFAALIPSGVTTLIQVALAVIIGLVILVITLPLMLSATVQWVAKSQAMPVVQAAAPKATTPVVAKPTTPTVTDHTDKNKK